MGLLKLKTRQVKSIEGIEMYLVGMIDERLGPKEKWWITYSTTSYENAEERLQEWRDEYGDKNHNYAIFSITLPLTLEPKKPTPKK